MSEIQVGQINSTDGSTAITTGADGYVSFAKTQMGGRRNLIINGAMQVAQRGTETTGVTGNGYHACDRWKFDTTANETLTISQSTDAPDGFAYSFKIDVTTADATADAADQSWISQRMEGYNLQSLKKGTSSAEQVTLSFWVKSTKTGTFIAELDDKDNFRNVSKSYTVNASDTWEYKTITFPADTTGTLDSDNGESMRVKFWLIAGSNFSSGTLAETWESNTNANRAVGQVNVFDDTANNFQITGVQLEVGPLATPFEHRSYGEELALCQRYYWRCGWPSTHNGQPNIGLGFYLNNSRVDMVIDLPVTMRTNPSIVANSGSGYWNAYVSADDLFDSWSGVNAPTNNTFIIYTTNGVSGSAGNAVLVGKKNSAASLAADAEL